MGFRDQPTVVAISSEATIDQREYLPLQNLQGPFLSEIRGKVDI